MQRRGWIFISALTFLSIIVWIVGDIVYRPPENIVDEKLQKIIEPLDPNFDSVTIAKLADIPLPEPIPEAQAQPTPPAVEQPLTPEPDIIATPSASILPTPSTPATSSGTL